MSYLQSDPDLKGATIHTPRAYTRDWYHKELAIFRWLADRGLIKARVDWHDGDGLHTHVCGYDPTDRTRRGCGHIWRHATPMNGTRPGYYDTKKELDDAHKCPHCGRENWTAKRLPGDPRLTKEHYEHEPEPKRGNDRRD